MPKIKQKGLAQYSIERAMKEQLGNDRWVNKDVKDNMTSLINNIITDICQNINNINSDERIDLVTFQKAAKPYIEAPNIQLSNQKTIACLDGIIASCELLKENYEEVEIIE